MEDVRTFARRVAQVNVPVLILGETGTGKSLLGRVIHQGSPRAMRPYLAINCAGIPDSLFESEFFGHERGAFTGARQGRRGILEQAQGGSLFLDEVGELSVSQQAKLLTALEEGEVRPLGGEGTVTVDVRVMAATARDLLREMREGGFRRDLFHRLAVLTCRLPSLRERREDIPLLARRLLRKHGERHGRPSCLLSKDALRFLVGQSWPGNVRELSHLLEAALILSEGEVLEAEALQKAMAMGQGESSTSRIEDRDLEASQGSGVRVQEDATEHSDSVHRRYAFHGTEEEERERIRSVLVRVRGNKSRAARELGMARNTLRQKLRRYALE